MSRRGVNVFEFLVPSCPRLQDRLFAPVTLILLVACLLMALLIPSIWVVISLVSAQSEAVLSGL